MTTNIAGMPKNVSWEMMCFLAHFDWETERWNPMLQLRRKLSNRKPPAAIIERQRRRKDFIKALGRLATVYRERA